MKVLFAVSNENISEAIIKRYPKEYREILSYKNVYYFNAILKEIQKDKSYDRIVISEDLEPFVNTNHDSIDNFIFEHLDKISDEAHDNEGKETAIILICSERRAPGAAILSKLFSIGVYNAVMGKDRNLTELCKLINRPRNKKEAKIYYRIDQATYDPVVENEVNEVEIQNILTHFKKLGKNTERYADSFNNIAAQYTDEQLKIIINVLPMKVKAVLEAESPKYQALMGSSGEDNKIKPTEQEPGIKINTIGKTTQINGPIVIPSSIKKPTRQPITTTQNQVSSSRQVAQRPISSSSANIANKQVVVKQASQEKPNTVNQQVQQPKPVENNMAKTIEDNNNISKDNIESSPSTGLDGLLEDLNSSVDTAEETVKRGRGRPKKIVQVSAADKPKGKRGRPRKNAVEEPDLNSLLNPEPEDNESDMLPGLESSNEIDDGILPGLDSDSSADEGILPGLDDTEDTLPGLDDSDSGLLPGLEDEEDNIELPGIKDNDEESDMLPGLDSSDDLELPGLDDTESKTELPGLEEEGEDVDVNELLAGLDDTSSSSTLPGLEDDTETELPGLDNTSSEEPEEETILPGMGFEDTTEEASGFDDFSFDSNADNSGNDNNNNNINNNINQNSNVAQIIQPKVNYSMSNLNSLLSKDKKIVTFIGTTKNGTSFLVNNLALMFSLMGINTAILDMTQNRNSYYIFTDSREELRNIAYTSIAKLENGYAEGIKVNKNMTVYTALPADGNKYENAEPILSTLVQNHSLVLIDCDFETPPAFFAMCQEIYLVQSMDILTIQPLTAFLRELKFKGAWEPEKARVVINKETKVKGLNGKMIIAGMSRYNGPDMSVMTDLFNRDMVKACSIPFDEKVYAKYLETMATCRLSLSGYSKTFMQKMQILSEMVYPRLNSKKSYGPMNNISSQPNTQSSNTNVFSNSMNNTLNQMKNKY